MAPHQVGLCAPRPAVPVRILPDADLANRASRACGDLTGSWRLPNAAGIVDNSTARRQVVSSRTPRRWEEQGANPLTMTTPEYKAFMQAQVEKWAKVIKANNIAPIN